MDKDPNHINIIKKTLKLDKKDRSKQQTNILIQYFKKLKVIQDLLKQDNDAYHQLCGVAETTEFLQNEMIIHEGDYGDTFYIIL